MGFYHKSKSQTQQSLLCKALDSIQIIKIKFIQTYPHRISLSLCVCVCERVWRTFAGGLPDIRQLLTGFHSNRNIEWRHVPRFNATITILLLCVPSPHISPPHPIPPLLSLLYLSLFKATLTYFPKTKSEIKKHLSTIHHVFIPVVTTKNAPVAA